MKDSIAQLENALDSFNPAERKRALSLLSEQARKGRIKLPDPATDVNLHCHTFFSYNCYGYSPSKFAWLARKQGLAVAGVVDFDVLDALSEFHHAAETVGLKAAAGIETRVFIPQFQTRVINSPGEPGISYHMATGLPGVELKDNEQKFLTNLSETAQQRNRDLTKRVNQYLKPVELDYENDVLTLTPSGNATERHISLAYARKAANIFPDKDHLASFWAEKLNCPKDSFDLPEAVNLLNTIRAKTMKRGGPGYVQPGKGSFPTLKDTNDFILAAGGIPTMTWLDGTNQGERDIEELLEVQINAGSAALNIIPDRNFNPGVKDIKLDNLYKIVELAEKNDLPIIVGTEMNSPGQKFVDDFASKELTPLVPLFLKGAYIIYAHSQLQRICRTGYLSNWATQNFENTKQKNTFYEQLGCLLKPAQSDILSSFNENTKPQEILDKIKSN